MGKIVTLKERVDSLTNALAARERKIASMLAGAIPPGHFIQVAISAAFSKPELYNCDQTSIIACVYKAASLGLSLDPAMKEYYLVPFKNRKAQTVNAQGIIGYKGLEVLAIRAGLVMDTYSRVVYDCDQFSWEEGACPALYHKPSLTRKQDAKIIGAYAVANLEGGRTRFRFVPIIEIEFEHRSRSKAKDSGPWVTDYPAMCRKTAVRLLCDELPRSRHDERMRQALQMEEQQESPVEQSDVDPGEIIIDLPANEADTDMEGVAAAAAALGTPAPETPIPEATE